MTFVVVYLIGAREFVVVLDAWVKELAKAKLMNYGVNANQDFRVFWSANDGYPYFEAEIKFSSPLKPGLVSNGEACYVCRVKKNFGMYTLNS